MVSGMVVVIILVFLGALLGYLISRVRRGSVLDRLQYAAVFGLIFLIIAISVQIIVMRVFLV